MNQPLPPYPGYKPAGLPWLAQVPAHWEMTRAKNLFQQMDRAVRAEDDVVTCFRDGVVTLRKNRRTRGFTEALKEHGYQGIRKGDLVIHGMDAFAGAIGVSDSDGKGTPVYIVCQPKQELEPEYFAHIIREMSRNQFILSLAKGIRERSTDFRYDMLASLTLPIPPLAEQQQIVAFLDAKGRQVARLLRAKRQLIKLLQEQKQALIHRTVTQGLNPDAPRKESGVAWLGAVPAHWEVVSINRIARVGNGSTPSRATPEYWQGGDYPWLNSSHANRDLIDTADQFVTPKALAECHLPKVPRGSVLVAITGQGKTRGMAALLNIEATINQHIAYITPVQKISSAYLRLVLAAAYPTLRSISEDAGSTKGALTCADLKHFKIAFPPFEEQSYLLQFVKAETHLIDETIARAQREIELIQEYRTCLVADVVTGRADVRGLAGAAGGTEAAGLDLLDEEEALEEELLEETAETDG